MPKTTAPGGGPQKRRRYTKEFKEEVVQMLRAVAPGATAGLPSSENPAIVLLWPPSHGTIYLRGQRRLRRSSRTSSSRRDPQNNGGLGRMPEISRFLGIVIRMYYRDHPPPHFHAEYGEHEITVDIDSGIVQGRFPRRALTAVLDWYNLHQDELARNWELVQAKQPLKPIEPLE